MKDPKSLEDLDVIETEGAKSEPLALTEDQKQYILKNWESTSLMEITQKISGDPSLNGHHKLGRLVREFLSERNVKMVTAKPQRKGEFSLEEPQRIFIRTNIDKMKTTEMLSLLFPDEKKSMLSAEGRAVHAYIKELSPTSVTKSEEPVLEVEIEIPKSIYKLAIIVNRYVPNPKNENINLLDLNNIRGLDEKNLRALLGYIQVPRFEYQANQYKMAVDRELFVSTFVRYLFDKPETPQEEVDQFISLAAEVVTTSQIDRNIQRLEAEMEQTYQETKRVSQGIVDYINAARDKLDKSKERQKKLYDALVGSRSKRLGDRLQNNASILNLVEAWQDEKKRNDMIDLAERQKDAESKDLDELSSMEAVMCLIAGVTRDEFLR